MNRLPNIMASNIDTMFNDFGQEVNTESLLFQQRLSVQSNGDQCKRFYSVIRVIKLPTSNFNR